MSKDRHEDFICRCGMPGPERDKVNAKVDQMMQRAFDLLSKGSANGGYAAVDYTNLLSAVVFHLNADYYANIEYIHTDQWSAVAAIRPGRHEGTAEFRTYIQCDRVEDGIAATYLAFVDKFGVPEDPSSDEASS